MLLQYLEHTVEAATTYVKIVKIILSILVLVAPSGILVIVHLRIVQVNGCSLKDKL